MSIAKHVMTPGDVARVLGVSPDWVRTMDRDLKPVKIENGHRRYDPTVVERVAKRRAAVRGAK